MEAEPSTVGDQDGCVVEGIRELRQTCVEARGRGLDFIGALHAKGFVWPFIVKFIDEAVEFSLLLKAVETGGARCLHLQGQMHALMASVLLRATRFDPFDADPKTKPPDGEFAEIEETVGWSKRNAVIRADGDRQARFLEQALKRCNGKHFPGRRQRFAE